MKKRILCLIIGLFLLESVVAQYVPDERWIREFVNTTYAGDWNRNEQLLEGLKTSDGMHSLFKAFRWRWEYLPIHHQEEIASQYFKLLQDASVVNKQSDGGFWGALAYMYMAEAYYNNGDHIKAFTTGKKLLSYLDELKIDEQKHDEYMLLKGIYLYYMDHVAENYSVLGSMMSWFYKGDKKKGLKYIEQVARSNSFAAAEAVVYFAHINTKLEKKPLLSLPYAKNMNDRYPDNAKFKEIYIENLLLCSQLSEVKSLNAFFVDNDYAYYRKKYHYHEGYILEYQNDLVRAENEYHKALEWAEKDQGESPHIKSLIYAGLGRIAQKKGQLTQAKNYSELVKKYRVYDYSLNKVS